MGFSIKDEMPDTVQQYAMYLRNIKGLSAKTVENYCMDLRTFFRFLKLHENLVPAHTPLDEIHIQDLDLEFIRGCMSWD